MAMKILLIILVLCLLLNVFLLAYPIRLAIELDKRRAAVYWLPYIGRRVSILQRDFAPPELIAALAEGDFERAADILLAKKGKPQADKAQSEKKQAGGRHELFSWANIRSCLGGGLAAVRVRRLRLQILVGGDPYRAAMLAGGLSAAVSAGLARLSAAVAEWPSDVRGAEVGLLSPASSLSDSRIVFSTEVSARVGTALWQILRRMSRK